MLEIKIKRVWVRKHPMPEVDDATMRQVQKALSDRLDAMIWDVFSGAPTTTHDHDFIDVQPVSVSPPLDPPFLHRIPLPLLDVATDMIRVVRDDA